MYTVKGLWAPRRLLAVLEREGKKSLIFCPLSVIREAREREKEESRDAKCRIDFNNRLRMLVRRASYEFRTMMNGRRVDGEGGVGNEGDSGGRRR